MKILITTCKIPLRRTLRNFITESLSRALERFVSSIAVAQLELTDRNGRRGEGDKRCRIRLFLTAGTPVLVEDVEANPPACHPACRRACPSCHPQPAVTRLTFCVDLLQASSRTVVDCRQAPTHQRSLP